MRLTWPISSLREAKVSSGIECERWFFAFTFSRVGKKKRKTDMPQERGALQVGRGAVGSRC